MAGTDSNTPRRFSCVALPPGRHFDVEDMIERLVEGVHDGRYAGYGTGDYIGTLRRQGGLLFSGDDGNPAGVFPFASRNERGTRLQFPLIDVRYERLGVQCLGQQMQFLAALLSSTAARPPVDLYIPFPDDCLPSGKLVTLLGLCEAMPERPAVRDPAWRNRVYRFDIKPAMLPRVVAAMLERSDPLGRTSSLIGAAFVNTIGTAGCARVQLPQEGSPLSAGFLPTLLALANGRLSVVGLDDIPVSRFGA